jgi:hypothetical protein
MKKSIFSLAFLLISVIIFAQENTASSGGDAMGIGGSASYSVGQVVYTTHTGVNGSIAQGVQQPYEISVVTAVKENDKINLVFTVYPNPTTHFLTLNIPNVKNSALSFWLSDITGKVLANEQIHNENTTITMETLPKAIYFLKITENDETIKTFKIIKQ